MIVTDTAGLRESVNAVEQAGVQRAESARSSADIVVSVIDGTALLQDLRPLWHDPSQTHLMVFTKADLLGAVPACPAPVQLLNTVLEATSTTMPTDHWDISKSRSCLICSTQPKGLDPLVALLTTVLRER